MDNKILDDDWSDVPPPDGNTNQTDAEGEKVILIKTFYDEQQAYIYAAALQQEGIEAQVVGTTTSGMTPFDYGTVRLYVADAQALEGAAVVHRIDAEMALKEQPQWSAAAILMILLIGFFLIACIFVFIKNVSGFLK
jgi:hypothetical protein